MQRITFIFLLIAMVGRVSFGQTSDSVSIAVPFMDSINHLHEINDILQTAKLNRHYDSLKILVWGDSMRLKINSTFNKTRASLSYLPDSLEEINLKANTLNLRIDSLINVTEPASNNFVFLKSRQDSLKKIKFPTSKYASQIDKAFLKQQQMLNELNTKQNELGQKVTRRYEKWENSIHSKVKLDSLGIKGAQKLPGLNQVNGSGISPNVPGNILGLNQNFISDLPKIPVLNTGDFSDLKLSNDLSGIGDNFTIPSMDQLNQWESIPTIGNNEFKGLTKQISVGSEMLKDPSKAAESAVGEIGEIQSLNKEIASVDNLKSGNEAFKIAESMKDENSLKEEAKKLAIDHFAGKEEVLKKSMDQMSKYKKKYPSLNRLADAKMKWWQPVNSLKEKPFKERIHPGINLGYSTKKDTLNLDFYPNLSYQISGRIEAGFGGLYRLNINTKNVALYQQEPDWGFTAFTTFKLYKSSHFRLETDLLNSKAPSVNSDGTIQRSWRWQMIMGIQKNFKISKALSGNVQMLYNFDKNLKDGFPERLMIRTGVFFILTHK